MNTLLEDGVADWLRVLLSTTYPSVPVLTGDDDTTAPDSAAAEPRYVLVTCEEDVHDIGPLWLPEIRVVTATPMNGAKTLADHRALASAVVGAFADANLAALSSAVQASAGRTVSGWYRLDEERDDYRRREGYWQTGPLWRLGAQEV